MTKKKIDQTNNEEILNAVKSEASSELRNMIDAGMRSGEGIQGLGTALTSYTPVLNEFINTLVNKIGRQIIGARMAQNKLAKFKGESMNFASTIEETWTNMATKNAFNQTTAETEVFKRQLPDVKTLYHRINRQDFYKTTISNEILRRAFFNATGLGQLVATVTDSLYSGAVNDEFKLTKELIAEFNTAGNFINQTVVAPTDTASTKALAKEIKRKVLQMGFMSRAYNKAGVDTRSDPQDLVLLLSPDVAVNMDLEILAFAFNSERVDFDTQVIVIDDFGTGMTTTQAVLVDKEWFRIYDTLTDSTSQYNAQGLYTNVFYHTHQIMSTSNFANAVQFKTA